MPRHRRFTTDGSSPQPQTYPLASFTAGLAGVAQFRWSPSPPRKNRHLAWLAALLLHAAVFALALITFQPSMSLGPPSQTQVSVVLENPGASQNTAPASPRQAPSRVAVVPPAPATGPPPPPQPQQPEMQLDIPQDLFSDTPLPPPPPQPQTEQAQNTRPQHHYVRTHHEYQVMNNMSLGNSSNGAPAPPMPNAQHGLNLQLSQSDLNALDRPEITVQGEIGSDWMNGFNKWVNEHIYYPQAAIENNQEGTSVISFIVHRDGRVTDLHLLSSAGSPFLDQAWLGIFIQNNVPPFPPGNKSDTIKITAALEYQLIH